MARPLRIEYPGAYYHVTSRGNERKAIFWDDRDRELFLELLARMVDDFHLRLHGYVLMSNHYHLLVETPKGGLPRALRYLNGVYTQAFNQRHRRVGHLFRGVKGDAVMRDVERYYGIRGEELRGRERRYTEPPYIASYLLWRYCLMGLREIGEQVGLHYSAVGNAIRKVRARPSVSQAKSLRSLEGKFKNQ